MWVLKLQFSATREQQSSIISTVSSEFFLHSPYFTLNQSLSQVYKFPIRHDNPTEVPPADVAHHWLHPVKSLSTEPPDLDSNDADGGGGSVELQEREREESQHMSHK